MALSENLFTTLETNLNSSHTIGTVKVQDILHATVKHAPCIRGTWYAAYTILSCGKDEKKLCELARDWLRDILLPCEFALH